MFPWLCPQCGLIVAFPSSAARLMAGRSSGCQSCRLRATLAQSPGLAAVVLDGFTRMKFPEGSSWKETVPESLLASYGQLETGELTDGDVRMLFGIGG